MTLLLLQHQEQAGRLAYPGISINGDRKLLLIFKNLKSVNRIYLDGVKAF
jgi:hypothetical protein